MFDWWLKRGKEREKGNRLGQSFEDKDEDHGQGWEGFCAGLGGRSVEASACLAAPSVAL